MMRRIAGALCVSLALATLVGCGSLNVSVDVLDPEHVRGEMDDISVHKLYREVQGALPGDFAKRADARFNAFAREVNELAARVRRTADALPPPDRDPVIRAAANLERGVGPAGDYRTQSDVRALDLETTAQKVREEASRLKFSGQGRLPAELRALLLEFQAIDKAMRSEQVAFVRTAERNLRYRTAAVPASAAASSVASPSAQAAAATVSPQAAVAVAVAARSIIGDGSLAATDFAYTVAAAPESLWQPNFNRAFADTRFGNADMVIRLNSTADFSVKGLLFDASKVAQVASKVLTQTVLVGAQIAGVPVPTASTGTQTGGDALSKSSSDLATADASLAARDARAAAQKNAIRSLARSMIAATPQLSAAGLAAKPPEDTDRRALHGSIDSAFTALRGLMSLQDQQ